MPQFSPQDLQALQQLISVIAPKIIERLKNAERQVLELGTRVSDLEEQVKILHANKAKAEKPKRGSKKKAPELQELLPSSDHPLPVNEVVFDQEEETTVPLTEAVVDAAQINATGTIDVGTVAVTQNVAEETGGILSSQEPAGVVSLDIPVVDGVSITGKIIYGVQYVMQQGYTDPNIIAQALQISPAIVQTVMDMPIAQQAAIIELDQQ